MNSWIMFLIKMAFNKAGYKTHSLSYKSLNFNEEETLNKIKVVVDNCAGDVYFVGHSMGGLVIRKFIDRFPSGRYKKIATIGTPHNGSYIANLVTESKLNSLVGINDASGLLSGMTEYKSNIPLGSIAGTKNVGILSSYHKIIGVKDTEPNDGTVYVKETINKDFTDSLLVNHSHSGMLFSKEVFDQIIYFFKTGHFKKTT